MTEEEFDNPNIRRVKASENSRVWPDKKLRTSSQKNPMPAPGQKNKIESILTALPVIMLVIGFVFYYKAEKAQENGTPIVEQAISVKATFTKLSTVEKFSNEKHYLWISTEKRDRRIRITAEQVAKLSALNAGDQLNVVLAPTVSGSNTLWALEVSFNGKTLLH